MRENPKPYELYRHFKGNLYQIITLATDSEDGRPLVVYQALYGDYRVYVRDLAMFMSETDHEKYPDVTQQYRFERVQCSDAEPAQEYHEGREYKPERGMQAEKSEQAAESEELAGSPETERVAEPDCEGNVSQITAPEDFVLDPAVVQYLDAAGIEERLNILTSVHHRITAEMLATMAVASDIELEEAPLEEQYQSLKNCLLTKRKFEKVRVF